MGNRKFILHRLREAIRSVDADIVFLQEVVGENSAQAEKHINWPDQAQHVFLADPQWKYFAYGKNAFYPDGHHAMRSFPSFPCCIPNKSTPRPTDLNSAVFLLRCNYSGQSETVALSLHSPGDFCRFTPQAAPHSSRLHKPTYSS